MTRGQRLRAALAILDCRAIHSDDVKGSRALRLLYSAKALVCLAIDRRVDMSDSDGEWVRDVGTWDAEARGGGVRYQTIAVERGLLGGWHVDAYEAGMSWFEHKARQRVDVAERRPS